MHANRAMAVSGNNFHLTSSKGGKGTNFVFELWTCLLAEETIKNKRRVHNSVE